MTGDEARRAYARAYAKKWRAENPERHREIQRNYVNRNRAKENARKREWARRNPDKVKLYRERYWAKKAAEISKAQDGDHIG